MRIPFEQEGVVGTILIATEGVNGTIAHQDPCTLRHLSNLVRTAVDKPRMRLKYSTALADNPVFYRLKIKVRDEIIQFGKSLTEADDRGQHVDADQWHALLNDPDVLVLDVRNDYEMEIGSFEGAVPVGINRFTEFTSEAVDKLLEQSNCSSVAMYCTGGIRCEKASNALVESGCSAVYQLDGGILGYLETVKPDENRWQGECFVFDQRVSVDSKLTEGRYDQCHACRRAISDDDKRSPLYERSVSCPRCFDETTTQQKRQFSERAKQVALAESRGERHVGQAQG